MGAGSKAARKFWLENLCREIRQKLEPAVVYGEALAQKTVDLPELRDGGVTISEVARQLGGYGVKVREVGNVHRAALTLEALGVVDAELTPAGYR